MAGRIHLVEAAFHILLVNYEFHPILWRLYSVNHNLRAKKPRMDKTRVIQWYHSTTESWLGGVGEGLHTVIAYDDTSKDDEGNPTVEAEITVGFGRTPTYVVPREWLKRIYVIADDDDDETATVDPNIAAAKAAKSILATRFVLADQEFCCRPILKRTDCKLVRCQSTIIQKHMHMDPHYFHVGCGPCLQEIAYLLVDVPIFLGIKTLGDVLGTMSFKTDLLYIIYVLGDEVEVELDFAKQDGVLVSYANSIIQNILKHVLVCKKCHRHLKDFIIIVDVSLDKCDPIPDYAEQVDVKTYVDSLPCNVFLVDGEFDVMREQYYKDLDNNIVIFPHVTGDNDDDKRHALVDYFIDSYMHTRITNNV
jgi:hypothetical protein